MRPPAPNTPPTRPPMTASSGAFSMLSAPPIPAFTPVSTPVTALFKKPGSFAAKVGAYFSIADNARLPPTLNAVGTSAKPAVAIAGSIAPPN